MDVSQLTIQESAKKMAAKEFSSEELISSYLTVIEGTNERLNALLSIADDAIDQAKAIDKRRADGEDLGPLAGIPVVMKDNILVQDWTASAGSRILENYKASYDATVTSHLKEAGAILIGRANCDEFAMGSSGENSHYGPSKNPWDDTKVPGGSSSGSAVAVAAGMAPVSLGSDTGGSIRQPASLCGVVGLKPTYGRVSRNGLIALASSLDQIGPFTRTAFDAALMLRAIEGNDAKDATTVESAESSIPELANTENLKGVRIGLPKEYFADGIDPEVSEAVNHAISDLKGLGADIVEISLPHAEYALAAYYIIMPAEASSNLGRFDGIRYGYSSNDDTLTGSYERSRGEGFGAEAKRRIMLGSYTLSAGYVDAYYKKALQVRSLIKRDFDEAFQHVDLVLSPTSPTVAWGIGEKFSDPLTMYLSDIYTISANLATIPAMSLPCGISSGGLPIGLQLMAKPFNESALFRAGIAYQGRTDHHQKTP